MTMLIMLGALAFAAIGLFGYGVAVYNGLVAVKNNILKAWANIDVLLKQRHDEIPKLIKTCEASMKFEKGLLERVVELRSAAQRAGSVGEKAQTEAALTGGLHKLFAVAESYPDVKSQSGFQSLQARITQLEDAIADRREFYNDSVNNYNIRIQSFPDSLVAGYMGLAAQEMFKAAEEERKDVAIDIQVP